VPRVFKGLMYRCRSFPISAILGKIYLKNKLKKTKE